jgi:hypothetical protein
MVLDNRMSHDPALRAHELTGKLCDDKIQDSEWCELITLLRNSTEGRRAYIETMLLQAELYYLGNEPRQEL